MKWIVHIFEDGRSAKTIQIQAAGRSEATTEANRLTDKYHKQRPLHEHLNYVQRVP